MPTAEPLLSFVIIITVCLFPLLEHLVRCARCTAAIAHHQFRWHQLCVRSFHRSLKFGCHLENR